MGCQGLAETYIYITFMYSLLILNLTHLNSDSRDEVASHSLHCSCFQWWLLLPQTRPGSSGQTCTLLSLFDDVSREWPEFSTASQLDPSLLPLGGPQPIDRCFSVDGNWAERLEPLEAGRRP